MYAPPAIGLKLEDTDGVLRPSACVGMEDPCHQWSSLKASRSLSDLLLTCEILFTRLALPSKVKHVFSTKLAQENGLVWSASGTDWFKRIAPWQWPPVLMDSGLLMCASKVPDASGFEQWYAC